MVVRVLGSVRPSPPVQFLAVQSVDAARVDRTARWSRLDGLAWIRGVGGRSPGLRTRGIRASFGPVWTLLGPPAVPDLPIGAAAGWSVLGGRSRRGVATVASTAAVVSAVRAVPVLPATRVAATRTIVIPALPLLLASRLRTAGTIVATVLPRVPTAAPIGTATPVDPVSVISPFGPVNPIRSRTPTGASLCGPSVLSGPGVPVVRRSGRWVVLLTAMASTWRHRVVRIGHDVPTPCRSQATGS